jgi:hypothetical protein
MPEERLNEQRFGRTWADFWTTSGGLLLLLVILGVGIYFGHEYIAAVPRWIWVSVLLTPMLFTPWLIQRARDSFEMVVVSDGPSRLTEYRIGKRVHIDIEGAGIVLTSRTGARRVLLTAFDPETRVGRGTALAEFTMFEMARDLSTLHRLSEAFSEHLRSERVTAEVVGIEVEKRVSKLSTRWLNILYGSLDPTEIEDALGLESDTVPAPTEMSLDEVVE